MSLGLSQMSLNVYLKCYCHPQSCTRPLVRSDWDARTRTTEHERDSGQLSKGIALAWQESGSSQGQSAMVSPSPLVLALIKHLSASGSRPRCLTRTIRIDKTRELELWVNLVCSSLCKSHVDQGGSELVPRHSILYRSSHRSGRSLLCLEMGSIVPDSSGQV